MASLREVGRARPESLVAFLPLVLDKLLLLMVKPPTVAGLTLNVGQVMREVKFRNNLSSSQAAFSAMAAVVRAVSAHLSHRNDSHGRNALLMTYIAYQVLLSLLLTIGLITHCQAHLPHLDPAISHYQYGAGGRQRQYR